MYWRNRIPNFPTASEPFSLKEAIIKFDRLQCDRKRQMVLKEDYLSIFLTHFGWVFDAWQNDEQLVRSSISRSASQVLRAAGTPPFLC
ncbi:hypothetical protein TNIN_66651 [Trichonephila inaurata madagascariensis]|uniref:Uncharacterized protein n=1 Tax=Trichonephila inaurata madagascariensis TaxID=2747483 RepID=A0A8X6X0M3_9ARAC|nr:hypothetical protein TNIN_66651 [Trichonephila inaurata madagascariensis]